MPVDGFLRHRNERTPIRRWIHFYIGSFEPCISWIHTATGQTGRIRIYGTLKGADGARSATRKRRRFKDLVLELQRPRPPAQRNRLSTVFGGRRQHYRALEHYLRGR